MDQTRWSTAPTGNLFFQSPEFHLNNEVKFPNPALYCPNYMAMTMDTNIFPYSGGQIIFEKMKVQKLKNQLCIIWSETAKFPLKN